MGERVLIGDCPNLSSEPRIIKRCAITSPVGQITGHVGARCRVTQHPDWNRIARNSHVKFYYLALGILAVWRITHFFQAEDGPWDVAVRLRRLVGNGFWGKLLDCFYCLSIWISAP